MKTDKKIEQCIVAAREVDLGDDSADAISVEAWNKTSKRKLAQRLGPHFPEIRRATLEKYIAKILAAH